MSYSKENYHKYENMEKQTKIKTQKFSTRVEQIAATTIRRKPYNQKNPSLASKNTESCFATLQSISLQKHSQSSINHLDVGKKYLAFIPFVRLV